MKRICVFCGSSLGARAEYAAAARELGSFLARKGIGIVFGAGNVGLMGQLADAALAGGGEVIGVIPHALVERELAHPGLSGIHVVRSMHERKALMAELSDAFIAAPGALGTFEEILEIVTWGQLGLHEKPCGVLNLRGYFDPLLALLDNAVDEGFLKPKHRGLLLVGETPADLYAQFESYLPPTVEKWITPGEE